MLRRLWIGLLLLHSTALLAAVGGNPGRDGPGGTLNAVVNTYYPGLSATATGTNSITLGVSRGAATPIASGDLLIIIQMQDATINSTNSADYGDGAGGNTGAGATSIGQSGLYEYIVATSAVPVGGGTLTFQGVGAGNGLLNSYFDANATTTQGQRRYQIVRVPQYSSATLGAGLTAAAWDGTCGGVLALDIAGTLALGGTTVSVNGLGFRGGGARQLNGTAAAGFADTDYRSVAPGAGTVGTHASKGEGIAGTPRYIYYGGAVVDLGVEGYPNGSFARGAPGNAGGGGSDGNVAANDQNSGGGGGGNGAAGGKGGDAWNSQEPYGGFGGALFAASPARMVLGGGGGAGTRNNSANAESSGGAGGGMVFIQCNAVSGMGTITANGAAGVNAQNDGAGGGGAGGSVLFFCASAMTGLTVQALGGDGGDSWPGQPANGTPGDRHGPGGGGGGGVVYTSGTSTISTTPGATGTTTTANSAFGATAGTTSTNTLTTLTAGQIPGVPGGFGIVPILTVVKTTSTPFVEKLDSTTATVVYTITVTNTTDRAAATNLSISDDLPLSGNANNSFRYTSTTSIVLTGGSVRASVSDPTANTNTPQWGVFTIPGGASVQITFQVTVGSNVARTTYQNPATATYLDPRRTTSTGTTSVSYDSASSTGEDVTLLLGFTIAAGNLSTLDRDGNGRLDAIKVTCATTVDLNDNFNFLNITVAGYTVTGYASVLGQAGDAANDHIFYVLLQEQTFTLLSSPYGDTGARPSVQVVSNNSLVNTAPNPDTILDTTGALTPLDLALPVLVACDWSDGSGGGVSANDLLYLRMSEPVTATNVLISHLGMPVTGDTLDATSVVQNITSSDTVTIQLLGNPLFSPGGTYSVSSLLPGSPSGIMINNGTNFRDASNNVALAQTFATAVDIRPGNVLLGIAWDDLSIGSRVWNIGNADVGTVHTAYAAFPLNGLVVRNVGNVRSRFTATCSVAAPALWAPASNAGINQFEMKAAVGGAPYTTYTLDLTNPVILAQQRYSGAAVPFDLRFVTPTEITSGAGVAQEITVTITVTQD